MESSFSNLQGMVKKVLMYKEDLGIGLTDIKVLQIRDLGRLNHAS